MYIKNSVDTNFSIIFKQRKPVLPLKKLDLLLCYPQLLGLPLHLKKLRDLMNHFFLTWVSFQNQLLQDCMYASADTGWGDTERNHDGKEDRTIIEVV